MAIESINPATGKRLKIFRAARWAAVDAALARAERVSRSWRALSMEQRAGGLLAAARVLRDRKERYGRLMSLEMGKPLGQAVAEVEKCAWGCEFFARNAEQLLAEERIPSEACK